MHTPASTESAPVRLPEVEVEESAELEEPEFEEPELSEEEVDEPAAEAARFNTTVHSEPLQPPPRMCNVIDPAELELPEDEEPDEEAKSMCAAKSSPIDATASSFESVTALPCVNEPE